MYTSLPTSGAYTFVTSEWYISFLFFSALWILY